MKKIVSIFLLLVISVSLCGCVGNSKYDEAVENLNSGNYEQALTLFEELALEGYGDSAEKVKEAKYYYIKANFNNDNQKTYQYLNELKMAGYNDSALLYSELYSWKVNIYFNDSQNGTDDKSSMSISKKYPPFYWVHFQFEGGIPGGQFDGYYVITFGNGEQVRKSYIGKELSAPFSVALYADYGRVGKTTFTAYDESGNVIGSKSVMIY